MERGSGAVCSTRGGRLVAEADDAVVGPVPAARPAGLTSASVADQACGVACTRVASRQ
jgi:hypothetical protein